MQLRNHAWPARHPHRRAAGGRCAVTFRSRRATLIAARLSPRCRDAARLLFLVR
ncbi:hypothetical protein [Actinoplanes sp. URMC 104]|uniref:hypothetical protein n=1 Tax=Actinoplanes sp. URMC 104 TaxID=3423409 RepID=UPI003F1D0054